MMCPSILQVCLDLIGVVVLSDLRTSAERTALRGACMLDALVLCPGLHRQKDASALHAGEFPACAAMTTGYVFRVENPATVAYLQRVGRTGHLTTIVIRTTARQTDKDAILSVSVASVSYSAAVVSTLTVLGTLISVGDWWAVMVMLTLCSVRLLNAVVLERRAQTRWHGAKEPGKTSDLLVLLSYDRWIRIQGLTDDVKAVTSGRWLREPTAIEGALTATATLLTYINAALAANASSKGKMLLLLLFVGSAALLGLANMFTTSLVMKGRLVEVVGDRRTYNRRRDLADELIREHGRDDWAIAMGMIVATDRDTFDRKLPGPVHM